MTLEDDVLLQFPAAQQSQHLGDRTVGDPPDDRNEVAEGSGDAFLRQVIVLLLLAVAFAAILFAVPAPEAPHPVDAVNKSATSAPHSKDTPRPQPADRDDAIPCSNLDYAYEKC